MLSVRGKAAVRLGSGVLIAGLAFLVAACQRSEPDKIEQSSNVSLDAPAPRLVTVRIDRENNIFLDDKLVSLEALELEFESIAALPEQPGVHVTADPSVEYETFAKVLRLAQRQGLQKLGAVGGS